MPQSIIANQLKLLYICSDNLSFWGVYLQIGCKAVTSNSAPVCNALANVNVVEKIQLVSVNEGPITLI